MATKLDLRFLDVGSGASQVNIENLPDGSTRKALTTAAQTITGQKQFTTLPRSTGTVTLDDHLIPKAYLDQRLNEFEPGSGGGTTIYCIKPIDSYGTSIPGTATEGFRFFKTDDYKIYTYTSGAFDAGVLVTTSFVALVLSTNAIISFNVSDQITKNHTSQLATTDVAGLVKIGSGLSITDGVVSVNLSATGGLSISSNAVKINLGNGLQIDGSNNLVVNQTQLSFITDAATVIKNGHIDWGTGANQINAASIPNSGALDESKVIITLAEANRIPTVDIAAALSGASAPTAANVFVTTSELSSIFNGTVKAGVQNVSELAGLSDYSDKDIRLVEDDSAFWRFDAQSVLEHDNLLVVKPSLIVEPEDPGRWIKIVEAKETPAHNSLTNLQGGTATEYYHLTLDQHTKLVTTDNESTLTNKTISGSSNTITNIPSSAIPDLGWTKILKTGSKLQDLENIVVTDGITGDVLKYNADTGIFTLENPNEGLVKITELDTVGYIGSKLDATLAVAGNTLKVADNTFAAYSHTHATTSSNAISISFTAGEILSAYSIVRFNSGDNRVYNARNTELSDSYTIVGITMTSANIGESVEIMLYGVITDVAFTYTSGDVLYCGATGQITTTNPIDNDANAKYNAIAGFAISTTSIFIRFGSPSIVAK